MTQTVRSFIALSMASCTRYSDSESSADVASSKSKSFGLTKSARAIAIPIKESRLENVRK